MSLSAGTRVGSFVIASLIGRGGMGEVYRARDERLGRDVAIKILPAGFTRDATRLDRFEREARVLASLNHPNIAAIYGVEGGPADAEHQFALVLELVEGETLADRIHSRGALPVDEALAIARQIADALDAAHEKGIVHRDLKPANIKVTPDGVVKVLDFGLAKAIGGSDAHGALDSTLGGTHEGVVLGTAAYMSPEQARAQPVDKRTDIWAFGCVLYEMLTGRPAFHASTMSDTIARILGDGPDWTALPTDVPAGVRQLLERCLERDTKRRLRDVGDLGLALGAREREATADPPRRRTTMLVALIATAAVLLTFAAIALMPFGTPPTDAGPAVRFQIPLSVRLPPASSFAVSPDGRRIVLAAAMSDGALGLWLRELDAIDLRLLSGTEGQIRPNTTLFWSPDGRSIGFFADGVIRRVDSAGGAPQDVCRVTGVSIGGTWNRSGVIVVGSTGGGLLRCPAAGGEAALVTRTSDTNTLHVFPAFLPDGRHVLYLRISRTDPSINGLYVADLERAPDDQSPERLVGTGFGATVVVSNDRSGHILFVRDQTLFAVRFDPRRRVVDGEPVQVAGPVGTFRDAALFGTTASLLVYRGAPPDVRLEWRARDGTEPRQAAVPGAYAGLTLAPGATRVAVLRENRQTRADQDLWLLDLARDTATRLTTDPQMESTPAWSHDGRALLFAVGHGAGDVMIQPLDGSPARVLLAKDARPEFRINPLLTTLHASADGRVLVMSADAPGRAQSDLWALSLVDGAVAPLVRQDFAQTQGAISPDGAWLAYVSDESGVNEVFVRPLTTTSGSTLPAAGPATVVSRGGGTAPRWRGNSRELFYQSPAGGVMSVAISTGEVGRPTELFRVPGLLPYWDVTREGDRFLLALPVTPGDQVPLTAVLNWQAGLAQ